jgi:glycosyltransferase involved in cell wall biosynthesis
MRNDVQVQTVPEDFSGLPAPAGRVLRWLKFRRRVSATISTLRPDLVIAVQFHALAAVPNHSKKPYRLALTVWDIPAIEDAGKFDRLILRWALRKTRGVDLTWASDIFKAEILQAAGRLPQAPRICHVGKPLDYLSRPQWARDQWLRHRLRREGAPLSETEGCIVLRAGAIGACGGLEETLQAMSALPPDIVLLLMGRGDSPYKSGLRRKIADLKLNQRVFIWDLPSDEEWKKALLGADVGHLIHGPFPDAHIRKQHELNSILSTVRLFNYMAAGLPIVAYDDPRMADFYRTVPCFKIARLNNLEADLQTILGELASDSGLRRRLGLIGRRAHEETFNWEAQFQTILPELLPRSVTSFSSQPNPV